MSDINWATKENKALLEAILCLKNEKEVRAFLRDLLTKKEIEEFASRLEAAKMLSNNVKYNLITEKTGLSSTTIARISKWLKGKQAGYKIVLERINHHTPLKVEKGLS